MEFRNMLLHAMDVTSLLEPTRQLYSMAQHGHGLGSHLVRHM
jgi:hypothetical protein